MPVDLLVASDDHPDATIRDLRALHRARARSRSPSRVRGGPLLLIFARTFAVASATSRTAFSKASVSAFAGPFVLPVTFRTYCSAAAWISSGVVGGSKWWRTRMLRHTPSA